MNRFEMISIIIDARKTEYENSDEFKEITHLFHPISINKGDDEIETFATKIHFYPTYSIINNGFSFEDEQYNKTGELKVSYNSYLSDDEIKSLSYFDYSRTKIYRLHIQGVGAPYFDWERTDAKNLFLITTKLIDYLKENPLTDHNNDTIEELDKIKIISSFCMKRDYEVLFFEN